MKLEKEPRLVGGPMFVRDVIDFLRKVCLVVNKNDDEKEAMKLQIADLEARVSALETP